MLKKAILFFGCACTAMTGALAPGAFADEAEEKPVGTFVCDTEDPLNGASTTNETQVAAGALACNEKEGTTSAFACETEDPLNGTSTTEETQVAAGTLACNEEGSSPLTSQEDSFACEGEDAEAPVKVIAGPALACGCKVFFGCSCHGKGKTKVAELGCACGGGDESELLC